MKKNLFSKLILIFGISTLLFSCIGESVIEIEPSTKEKLVGSWSNYYLGTFEFSSDGTFFYDYENSGYILFGTWDIENEDLVILYENNTESFIYEITKLEGGNLIICPIIAPGEICEEYEKQL